MKGSLTYHDHRGEYSQALSLYKGRNNKKLNYSEVESDLVWQPVGPGMACSRREKQDRSGSRRLRRWTKMTEAAKPCSGSQRASWERKSREEKELSAEQTPSCSINSLILLIIATPPYVTCLPSFSGLSAAPPPGRVIDWLPDCWAYIQREEDRNVLWFLFETSSTFYFLAQFLVDLWAYLP